MNERIKFGCYCILTGSGVSVMRGKGGDEGLVGISTSS